MFRSKPNKAANGSGDGSHYMYLWADQPSAHSYTPNALYQYNSTESTPMLRNTVEHNSNPASWTVHLPGRDRFGERFDTEGGHVQVTAYGPNAAHCTVTSWHPNTTIFGQDVQVSCATPAGSPAEVPFTLSYATATSIIGVHNDYGSDYAQGWAVPGTGLPSPYLDAPGGGRVDRSTRLGQYSVTFPDVARRPDHVQVTAYGRTGNYCTLGPWSGDSAYPNYGGPAVINVTCFRSGGVPVDTPFNIAYLGSVVGIG
jgi:hypothetical protein